jgi:hypothetical protein
MAGVNNMRIVADNAASRAATLTASSTSGVLAVSNLQIDDKSVVWRATGTTATLTVTWSAAETVSCVALPFCNLSPTATIRVRGYSDAAGVTQVFDTAAQLACPAPAVRLRGWTAAQAASAYANGGGAYARIWFAAASVQRIVIDLADASNLQGYIEAACLVVGAYWAPVYNASSASMTPVDTTDLYRTDAGGQGADAGYIYRQMPIDLSLMPPADRATFVNILRNSRAYPILVSLFPNSSDLELERDNMIYGRRSKDSDVAIQYARAYSTTIEIEEI